MKGHPAVVESLNGLLTGDLTAIDLYLIQEKLFEDRGYTKLAQHFAHERQEEEVHVAQLLERILFLEGTPNVADRIGFEVKGDVRTLLEQDLAYEVDVAQKLNAGIALCREHGDNASRELMERLLRDTENDHILWLESQLRLIDDIGPERYLAEQL